VHVREQRVRRRQAAESDEAVASQQSPAHRLSATTATSAVDSVQSLPLVGPIVKRIRHRAPDQRVMVINESPEESCNNNN